MRRRRRRRRRRRGDFALAVVRILYD